MSGKCLEHGYASKLSGVTNVNLPMPKLSSDFHKFNMASACVAMTFSPVLTAGQSAHRTAGEYIMTSCVNMMRRHSTFHCGHVSCPKWWKVCDVGK